MNTKQTRRKDKGLPGNGGQYAETEHAAADEVGLKAPGQCTVAEMLDEGYLYPSAVGLDDLRVDYVGLHDYGDGPEITAETTFDVGFCARDFIEDDIDGDAAIHFVERSVNDGDFERLISNRYPNAEVGEFLDDGPVVVFHAEVASDSTLDEAGQKVLAETGLVDYYNESDPGTFGHIDFNRVVRDLALIKGGGEVRDLRKFDELMIPSEQDRASAMALVATQASNDPDLGASWNRLMGPDTPKTADNVMKYRRLCDQLVLDSPELAAQVPETSARIARDNQLERALKKNIAIPADYQEAFNKAWEQRRDSADKEFASADGNVYPEHYDKLYREIKTHGRGDAETVARIRGQVEKARRQKINKLMSEYAKKPERTYLA